MAKVRVLLNVNDGSSNRIMGLFINDELIQSNDPRETRKRKLALKAAKKASGEKSGVAWLGFEDMKLKAENTVDVRQKGLTGKFAPAKKVITFSASDTSKVTIKVSKRGFIFGLIFGKYNISVKVK